MGVNSLITWAVIDQVMRTVIIETRASGSASGYCMNAKDTSSKLCILAIAVRQRRGFRPLRLDTTVVLRSGFRVLRLGY